MENTTTSEAAPTLVQHACRYGVIIGSIGLIITILLYAVDYSLLADWKIFILIIAINIGFVIYAGINFRNEIGGYLSYGKAFQHGFLMLAVGGIINIVFSIILYNVIDPELPQKMTDVTVEKTAAMMQGFGAPEDKIDEQVDKLKADMPANYSVIGQLKTYFWALIVYAVISAITSLFVRRNQPEVM